MKRGVTNTRWGDDHHMAYSWVMFGPFMLEVTLRPNPVWLVRIGLGRTHSVIIKVR